MKYGFSKKSLCAYVENAGMKYFHIGALGIPSVLRKGLGTSASRQKLFNNYETRLLPKQKEAELQLRQLIADNPRIALMCFEADHRLCHRFTLVEYLKKGKPLRKPVVHL